MGATGGDTHNVISGMVVGPVIQVGEARDITVRLPAQVTPALSGLPAATRTFTGRNTDLDSLLSLLDPAGLQAVTVVVSAVAGLAGVGKTELALQAAHQARARGWFPGGVLFVDLYGYDEARRVEPGRAMEGFLRALGISAKHIPVDSQDRSRLYASVLAAFAEQDRRILVVVDNVSSAEQARPLLPTGGVTGAVVTSRQTLGGLGARLLDLDVLGPEDAVELLSRALHTARGSSDTRVRDNPAEAHRVARLCGYLPLALQIVAALLAEDPTRPLTGMTADLTDTRTRLDEMRSGEQAVRGAFDLSYRHLAAEEARLFRLLTHNPGPDISTEAAAVLAEIDQPHTRRMLEALARAHIIEHASSYSRWRMHDLVRLYAADHGHAHAEADGAPAALDRLLSHYLTTAQAADAHLSPVGDRATSRFPTRDEALEWLDAERLNLTATGTNAAVAPTVRLKLSFALAWFLDWRRHFDDWRVVAEAGLQAARHLGHRHGEGIALNNLGRALNGLRRFDEAITAHQQATTIFQETGDRHGEAMALNNLGLALREVRRFDDAITAHQQATTIFRETGDRYREGLALNNLGLALREVRRFDDAITAHQQAATIYQETGDRHGEGTALNNLGNALLELRRFDDAITAHQQAATIYRETGDRHGEATALNNLGNALRKVRRRRRWLPRWKWWRSARD